MITQSRMRGFWGIVIAQFTGAFNDNAFRLFLIALAIRGLDVRRDRLRLQALAAALFLLPYLLVSMHAGSLADRLSKRTVLMWSKSAEALIMLLGAAGFFLFGDRPFAYLCGLLFLLGIQSAYYSPAKFGAMPELLPESRLSWGNGLLELTGFLGIISGSYMGPQLLGYFDSTYPYLPCIIFAGVALAGLAATWAVPRLPAAAPERPIRINPIDAIVRHGGKLVRHPLLLVTLLGVVYIWSLGLLLQLNVVVYANENLGLPEEELGLPMVTVAIGVGLGSLAAGYLSGKTIEVGLVPLGAAGTAFSSLALYFTRNSLGFSLAALGGIGFFAGLFIIPTHALLQEESEEEDKGGIWAATNFLQTLGMLLAAGCWYFLSNTVGLLPETIFLLTGAATLLAAGGIAFALTETLGRLIAWGIARKQRVSIEGQEHVPPRGPILFTMNGAPRQNALLLLAGTRRFVHFTAPERAFAGAAGAAVRFLRGIPIAAPADAHAVRASLTAVEESLLRGQAVCVFEDPFANGAGDPGSYLETLRALAAKRIAPVVPVNVGPASTRDRSGTAVAFGPAIAAPLEQPLFASTSSGADPAGPLGAR